MNFFLALLIGFVLTGGPAGTSDSSYISFEDTIYKTQTFTTDGPVELTALTSGGSITVESHDRDVVVIDVIVRRGSSYITDPEEVERYVQLSFSQNGNRIAVEAENKSRSNGLFSRNNASVSYVIKTPVETSVDLRTSGGSVSLNGVEGSQSLRTSGGSISMSEIEGTIGARTSGGSLRMSHIRGELDARTSGGSVTLKQSHGELDVRTSGGSITLENVSGNITGHTSGGSINADINDLDANLNLRTSGGSVTASIPAQLASLDGKGLIIDLRGSRVRLEGTTGTSFEGETTGSRIRGIYGNGGVSISLNTSAGTSTLRFR